MAVAFWHTPQFTRFIVRYISSPSKSSAKDNRGDSSPANKNGGLIMTGVQGFLGPQETRASEMT
jgi:hypothetical protein